MSWDVDLVATDLDGNEVRVGEWNYTHNMNRAINEALGNPNVSTYWAKQFGGCWWELIEDKPAKESISLFETVITAFRAEPDKYKALEPDNKWGSCETLIPVFTEMAEAARKYPSAKWSFSV